MPLRGLLVPIAAGIIIAALGLSATLDAIELFNQGRYLRAAALLALGIVLMGGGIMLAARFIARI